MAAILRTTCSLTTVRLKTEGAGNGAPAPEKRYPPAATRPLISISRPSWIVRTESNVRKESIPKPDPPCVVCRGSGTVPCVFCDGRGRTNRIESNMLPKGEWPKWCKTCRGSGLGYCNRCLGTGEYRHRVGFNFMFDDDKDTKQDNRSGRK